MKSMKALVTGVAGFVGSNLARHLLADGYDVIGIDSITDYYDVEIKRRALANLASPNFEFIEADINSTDLDKLLSDVDVVFHQAGQPGVRLSWGKDFSTYTSANIEATQKLLEAAVGKVRIRKFVYASSSSIYGEAERYPTVETDRPQPFSPYGVTKLAAEHLCSLYAKNFEVPTVSLRYFTVYGPGQRPDMAFTRFTRAAVTGSPITIFGDGEQTRDFTYVDDVVRANIQAGGSDVPAGSVFNVAGGTNASVNQVLDILSHLSERRLDVQYVGGVAGDVRQTGGGTRRIEKALGWRPEVSLEQGLSHHLDWATNQFVDTRTV
jgi:UDP-glucuronate 4-epimerase